LILKKHKSTADFFFLIPDKNNPDNADSENDTEYPDIINQEFLKV